MQAEPSGNPSEAPVLFLAAVQGLWRTPQNRQRRQPLGQPRTDEGKHYLVTKGTNKCKPNSSLSKETTFYILGAREIAEPVDKIGGLGGFGPGLKLWPEGVAPEWTTVDSEGALLAKQHMTSTVNFMKNSLDYTQETQLSFRESTCLKGSKSSREKTYPTTDGTTLLQHITGHIIEGIVATEAQR